MEWLELDLGEKIVYVGSGANRKPVAYTLDLVTNEWTSKHISGTTFSALSDHSACPIGRSKIVLYGGLRDGQMCSDVSIVNSDSMHWQACHPYSPEIY